MAYRSALRSHFLAQLVLVGLLTGVAHAGQAGARGLTSGEAIFHAGCAGCHGPNGEGAPDATVGFEKPATFPDFTDCPSTTPEQDVDWRATIHDGSGAVRSGLGDLGIGVKRVFFAGTNAILSAQGELVLPTGDKEKGLGEGVSVVEMFGAYGQLLPSHMFLQLQGGTEQPTSTTDAVRTVFARAAFGRSFRQELGYGRMWSPMVELVADREFAPGARTSLDILPQFQVTLNRRQHVRVNVGWQVPVSSREGRRSQIVCYVLWDWFDGGLLDGWR